VGQEHVVQALANALTQQRLHHAYLFTGTRGVGKTTISRILAKSLNCTGPDGQGRDHRAPLRRVRCLPRHRSGRFIDYVELDAASNRGVDEISQLLDQAGLQAGCWRFKVYMIDEVHMLSTPAFNAMLKTLEEPPEYLKFVLATTDRRRCRRPCLSRCLQFNLRPMAPQTVQEHLAAVLAQEGIAPSPARCAARARGARLDARCALAHRPGDRLRRGALEERRAPDARRGRPRPCVRLSRRSRARRRGADRGVDGLRELGLSAAGTLEELAALLQQMAVRRRCPARSTRRPDAAGARLAALLPADETQLLYSIACTAAPSWRWRPTNTAAW
jgi:DNA polymerase-3 subunit gamma/tau